MGFFMVLDCEIIFLEKLFDLILLFLIKTGITVISTNIKQYFMAFISNLPLPVKPLSQTYCI